MTCVLFPVFLRGLAAFFPKYLPKVCIGGEPTLQADLRNAHLCFNKKFFRHIQTVFCKIFRRRFPDCIPEAAEAFPGAYRRRGRDFVQSDFFREILMDKGQHSLNPILVSEIYLLYRAAADFIQKEQPDF